MSGHSKWKTIKHAKAAADAKRGKAFSLIGKEITIAVKAGGPKVDFNPRLRTILLKAKAANMPSDNIQRAIQKGTGELPGVQIEELVYEGYGANGVGFVVEVTTDNKNRMAAEVRHAFDKFGSGLANPGALMFIFKRKGQFLIAKEKIAEDQLFEMALNAGAEEIENEEEGYEVTCETSNFDALSKAFEKAHLEIDFADLVYIPSTYIPITDVKIALQVQTLEKALDEIEDVKSVYSNYEITPDVAEKLDLFTQSSFQTNASNPIGG